MARDLPPSQRRRNCSQRPSKGRRQNRNKPGRSTSFRRTPPGSYQDYTGDTQQITERQAADEFKLQTGVEPLKLHWASIRGLPGAETGTLVAAVAQDAASRVPRWISLFGSRLPVVRKSKKP